MKRNTYDRRLKNIFCNIYAPANDDDGDGEQGFFRNDAIYSFQNISKIA
ncbi:MAG: hypothetical protein ACHQQQ_10805 [Bacteroidota bacterium]